MIQHPPSALLTHVPRPTFGVQPIQPGAQQEGAFSNPENLRMLVPLILIAFYESNREENSFMNLCTKVTNLLATNRQLNNTDAWYMVLRELRMPLITNTGGLYYTGPQLVPEDPNYPRLLFQVYCQDISRTARNFVLYPAGVILGEWQQRIINYSVAVYEPFEDFKNAVSAWVWVANNYVPFKPIVDFFEEFANVLVYQSTDRAWEFFVNNAWKGVQIDIENFNIAIITQMLNARAILSANRTLKYVLSKMPIYHFGPFLKALVTYMSKNQYKTLVRDGYQALDEAHISNFYKSLLLPIFRHIKNVSSSSEYLQLLNSLGSALSKYFSRFPGFPYSRLTELNIALFNVRVFLLNSFPPEYTFVGNFETFMTDEEDKKTMRSVLTSETTLDAAYPFSWPTPFYEQLEQ